MKNTLAEFVEFAMRMDYKIEPYQRRILELLTDKNYRPPYMFRPGVNIQLRWLTQLAALRINWEDGKSTVMFSIPCCVLPKAEPIFDDFIYIDE